MLDRSLTWSRRQQQGKPGFYAALLAIYALLLASLLLIFGSGTAAGEPESLPAMDELFGPYSALLEEHLIERETEQGGLVSAFDYRGALENSDSFARIDAQNERLASFHPEVIDQREYAVAFWLNAYNYFMLAHILEDARQDGELIDSVRDYGSFFNPYRIFTRELFEIGGRDYSLDEMEKEILLGEEFAERGWKEARVHFAVNCASVGCPPLRSSIYEPATIDEVLTENTRYALNTERHMHIEGETLYVSEIFDWYEEDYVEEEGSVRAFIERYADAQRHDAVRNASRIRYIDYDWSLNEPENFPEIENPVNSMARESAVRSGAALSVPHRDARARAS